MPRGTYVPGIGPVGAKIAFIGEAPGEREEAIGKPFMGPSGNLLDQILSDLHMSRNDIYITNVLKYRPPFNNFYRYKEIGLNLVDCVRELKNEIEQFDPNVCIIFGANALKSLTGKDKIMDWRGSILPFAGRKAIPTIHPAHILHSAGRQEQAKYWMKNLIKLDINRAREESQSKYYEPSRKMHTVCRSSEHLWTFLERYKDEEYLASDIETTRGAKGMPICVSFCFNEMESISIPLFDKIPIIDTKLDKPTKAKFEKNNFTREYKIIDEISTGVPKHQLPEIWRMIARTYANPKFKQIGQNFKYDEDKLNRLWVLPQ